VGRVVDHVIAPPDADHARVVRQVLVDEVLARRPHRTWTITIASLAIARRHGDVDMSPAMALGTIDDRNL
jgi:hypothetical protein